MKKSATNDFPKQKMKFGVYMKKYWQLYVLLSLPLLYLLIFKYFPMVYIQIAFKKYSIVKPLSEMAWAKNHGFEYFIKAFKNRDFIRALRNTISLNLLDLVLGFPVPIMFALVLNELRFKRFKKVVQEVRNHVRDGILRHPYPGEDREEERFHIEGGDRAGCCV